MRVECRILSFAAAPEGGNLNAKGYEPMTKLRKRMMEDMALAGLAPRTQASYARAVAQLAVRYRTPPDRLSEEQVRGYFLGLIEVEHAARGTFQYKSGGIRFFYVQTLGLDWALFSKKNSAPRGRNVCRDPSRMATSRNWSAGFDRPSIASPSR